jgi:DNA replication protein DnaC
MKTPKNMLVFLGGFGIGKTTFCASLVPWALANFRTCRFWTENLLLKRLRDVIADGSGDYMTALKYLLDDDFVIYDDFGSSGANDWRKEVLGEVIDNRWASDLPTVITSNLTQSEIYSQYGGRTHSRIFDKRNLIIDDRESVDHRRA